MAPEFNLLDEPWIRVLKKDCSEQEVSITEALIHAHEYLDLSGDMPEQDMAVLRLLLAVLHTVFSRVDENGQAGKMETKPQARKRWKNLWMKGQFSPQAISEYLEQVHERFWLFHEKYPFYQIPEAVVGTEYTAAKLNGELSESGNKVRLFSQCSGLKKQEMTYAEAARWLLYVNAYDDTSAKPKGKGLPSPGVGWPGKLGLIAAVGDNLFETLMLNLTLLKDGQELWDGENRPIWEVEPSKAERREIAVPDNPAELLTIQSRRLLLKRDRGMVVGYYLLGGDFFEKEMAYAEQMTVWRKAAGKDSLEYSPRRHDPSRQMWRDFGTIFAKNGGNVHNPGIVMWYHAIAKQMGWKPNTVRKFRIVSVQYGDKDFFVNDTFSDSLTFHAEILLELNLKWQDHILAEIDKCEAVAQNIGLLSSNLAKAKGTTPNPGKAKDQFYSRVDQTFREWLRDILPEDGNEEETCKILEKEIQKIARKLADELVSEAGEAAFAGRMVDNQYYAAPEAYNWVLGKMYKIFR